MRSVAKLSSFALVLMPLATLAAAASPSLDWPSFRGPDRSGVSPETGLLQSWPEGGPPLVWEARGAGRGYASLAIAGDLILTLGDGSSVLNDADEYLLAFDRATGKPRWQLRLGSPWTNGSPTWQSSRSTPTIDGDRAYALTAFGDLVCCETATGRELWRKQLKDDFGGKKGDSWGYSESVLIDGDRLICTPGGERATIVALDKHSGALIWKSVRPGDRGAGHASVVVSQVGPTKVYVQTTASGALGVRADDGKLMWSYEIERTTSVIPTPIVRDDLVFFAAGYRRGGALLRQVPSAGGDVTIDEIYPINTELANKHGGIVLVGDYLYGDSDDRGTPYCAELMTGNIAWRSRSSGSGSKAVAAADGCLYIHAADGTMALVRATPEGFEELGSFKLPGSGERPGWSHPVIVDGKLYVREHDSILCYDIRAK